MKSLKKKLVAMAACVCAMLCTSISVFASEASGTANQAVVTAMTDTASDMIATGTAILPIALGVVGLILVVTFGIKIFKSVSKSRTLTGKFRIKSLDARFAAGHSLYLG